MIKKTILITTFLSALFSGFLSASEAWPVSAEFRGAAFIPSSDRFRAIYNNVNPSWQVEVNYPWRENWTFWGNVDWFNRRGHSTGCSHTSTRVQIASFSGGMKYNYYLGYNSSIYLGLGAVISGINLKNRGEKVTRNCAGGLVIKSGINHALNPSVFIDLFCDYYYEPGIYKTHVDIGGIKTGIGVGSYF